MCKTVCLDKKNGAGYTRNWILISAEKEKLYYLYAK